MKIFFDSFKMRVLYWALRLATAIAIVVCHKKGSIYELPFKWLHHYLAGSGKPMNVPGDVIEEASSGILWAIENYLHRYGANGKPSICGRYFLSHSTMYEGRGFSNRPRLFYLVGCFAFDIKTDGKNFVIHAEDGYDWHPAEVLPNGTELYYNSNFNIPVWVVKVCGRIFGEDLFPMEGFPEGQPGVSNKLWAKMAKYGAKEFTTIVDYKVPRNSKLHEELIHLSKKKKEIYVSRFLCDECDISSYEWSRQSYQKLCEFVYPMLDGTSRDKRVLESVKARKIELKKALEKGNIDSFINMILRAGHLSPEELLRKTKRGSKVSQAEHERETCSSRSFRRSPFRR